MSAWTELVATALIGTDRRPTASENPAAEVLDLAASWTPYQRAGFQPTTMDTEPQAAPAEKTPPAAEASGTRLTTLLDGRAAMDGTMRHAVLLEWLGLAAGRGRRVPPHLLPTLLDHAQSRADLRPLLRHCGGARLRWLAEQNPDWHYLVRAADESSADTWDTGTQAQRLGHVRHLRRTDPAGARRLLDRDWDTLAADERADLVAALGVRLDLADEALLERALDDRRIEVRDAAVDLLARLRGSAYQARMAGRASACVTVRSSGELLVSAPAECDGSMRRDGITPKPPAGTGARAWWLEEVLAHAPLSTWPGPAERFFARPVSDDWSATVHHGLARAAAAQRDPRWAAAALDVIGGSVRDRNVLAQLYPVLERDELVRRASAALGRDAAPLWGPILGACPAPWPVELGHAALGGIASIARKPALAGDLYQLCRLAAVRLPVQLAPAVRELAERIRAELPDTAQRALGLGMLDSVLSSATR